MSENTQSELKSQQPQTTIKEQLTWLRKQASEAEPLPIDVHDYSLLPDLPASTYLLEISKSLNKLSKIQTLSDESLHENGAPSSPLNYQLDAFLSF